MLAARVESANCPVAYQGLNHHFAKLRFHELPHEIPGLLSP
ncbi:hypothetical protein [Bathymodiolus japonicus methanotrophic gill symbiont]|nr:hypothetical protein [Bathymodiolus japonicus methanotrophic gill symbiont]